MDEDMLSKIWEKYKMQILQMTTLAILILATCGACTALNKWVGLPNDNAIEQYIEKEIKEGLGLDVDLSPEGNDESSKVTTLNHKI